MLPYKFEEKSKKLQTFKVCGCLSRINYMKEHLCLKLTLSSLHSCRHPAYPWKQQYHSNSSCSPDSVVCFDDNLCGVSPDLPATEES